MWTLCHPSDQMEVGFSHISLDLFSSSYFISIFDCAYLSLSFFIFLRYSDQVSLWIWIFLLIYNHQFALIVKEENCTKIFFILLSVADFWYGPLTLPVVQICIWNYFLREHQILWYWLFRPSSNSAFEAQLEGYQTHSSFLRAIYDNVASINKPMISLIKMGWPVHQFRFI